MLYSDWIEKGERELLPVRWKWCLTSPKWRSSNSGNRLEVDWCICIASLVDVSDSSELSVDLFGGKIDDMESENCGCGCLSLDSELSVDLFGGKIDDMEWEYCGTVSLDAEPPDPELFGGKIDAMEECDILVSSQIELSKTKLKNFVRRRLHWLGLPKVF